MYKRFYNVGNDSAFFNSCRPTAGTPLGEMYRCCRKTCAASTMCDELCSNIYPGTLLEDCAYRADCWRGGAFDQECIASKSAIIQGCCIDKCRADRYSDLSSVSNLRVPTPHTLDCNDYCQINFNEEVIDD